MSVPRDKISGIKVAIEQDGMVKFDAAADFSAEQNPAGAWSYGWRAKPAAKFHRYPQKDKQVSAAYPGLVIWADQAHDLHPCISFNPAQETTHPNGNPTFQPRQLAFHPGPRGEYCVIRWTAPQSGRCRITGTFAGISGYGGSPQTTTDVAVYHQDRKLFNSWVNLQGKGNQTEFELFETVEQGDVIDFVVGCGNGDINHDTTALDATVVLGTETPEKK